MHNDLLAIIQGTLQADPNVRLTAELSLAKLSSNSRAPPTSSSNFVHYVYADPLLP